MGRPLDHRPQNLQQAGEIAASLIESPELSGLWDEFYPSQSKQNPAKPIAHDLRSREISLAFARELTAIELKALGKPSKAESETIKSLRGELEILNRYLNAMSENKNPPASSWKRLQRPFLSRFDSLPEPQQKFLAALERKTALKPFRPLETAGKVMGHLKDDFKKYATHHPFVFSTLMSVSFAMAALINIRTGVKTSYKEPETTALENPIFDENGNMTGVTVNHDQITYDFKPSCDDHFAQLWPSAHNLMREHGIPTPEIPHCSKLKDIGMNTEQIATTLYEYSKIPMQFMMNNTLLNPTGSIGTEDFQGSNYMTGFKTGAYDGSEIIYAANSWENAVIHGSMFVISYLAVMGLANKALNEEERTEMKNSIKDFLYRAKHSRPMNYQFAAAAMAITAGINAMGENVLQPNLVMAGLAGTLAGQFAHKIKARHENKSFVLKTVQAARPLLREFAEAVKDFPEEAQPKQKSWTVRMNGYGKKAAVAGCTISTYFSLIAADVNGLFESAPAMADLMEKIGYGSGLLTSLAVFVPLNVIEDTAQHIAITTLGSSAGMTTLAIAFPILLANQMRKKWSKEVKAAFLAGVLSLTPARITDQSASKEESGYAAPLNDLQLSQPPPARHAFFPQNVRRDFV